MLLGHFPSQQFDEAGDGSGMRHGSPECEGDEGGVGEHCCGLVKSTVVVVVGVCRLLKIKTIQSCVNLELVAVGKRDR